MKRLIAIFIFLFTATAYPTTWAPSKLTDPLTGDKVDAQEVVSYGSYIYSWPSKFDIVFWPFTDENLICINPKNGYGAFNKDFEKVSKEDKAVLTKWLKENYNPSQPPKSHKEKLLWLEKVYGQRKMDDKFWCVFYRIMAYTFQDDKEASLSYVKKTMPLLEKRLAANPQGIERIETLYLLGEYNRRLGNIEKAKEFFSEVKKTEYKDEDGKIMVGHPYILELIEDREKLMNQGAPK